MKMAECGEGSHGITVIGPSNAVQLIQLTSIHALIKIPTSNVVNVYP